MAAAFPTDGGLTLYAVMPTKERLPEFRADPARRRWSTSWRRCPRPRRSAPRAWSDSCMGKLDMTNVTHAATAPVSRSSVTPRGA